MGKNVPMGNATHRRRGYYHPQLVTRLETIQRQLRERERERARENESENESENANENE
jgi:hypothetical protein